MERSRVPNGGTGRAPQTITRICKALEAAWSGKCGCGGWEVH
jgi:hypothetical protein